MSTLFSFSSRAEKLNNRLFGDSEDQNIILDEIESIYSEYTKYLTEKNENIEEYILVGNLCRFIWMRGYKDTDKIEGMILNIENFPSEHNTVIANFLYGIGQLFYARAEYKKCRKYLKDALEMVEESSFIKACIINQLGMVDREQHLLEDARKKHEKALKIFLTKTTTKYLWGQANSLNNLGVVSIRMNEIEKSLDNHQQSLSIRKQINEAIGISSSLGNVALCQFHLRRYEEAKKLYEESLLLRIQNKDRWGISGSYLCLGKVSMELGKQKKNFKLLKDSCDFLEKSLQGFVDVNDDLGIAEVSEIVLKLCYYLQEMCGNENREKGKQETEKKNSLNFVCCEENSSIMMGIVMSCRKFINTPVPQEILNLQGSFNQKLVKSAYLSMNEKQKRVKRIFEIIKFLRGRFRNICKE